VSIGQSYVRRGGGSGKDHELRMTHPSMRLVTIRGVSFSAVTEHECAEHVIQESAQGRGGWVVTVNTDILLRYERNEEFRALVEPAALFVADGMPLIWASRLAGEPLPERVAGSSLLFSICEAAAGAQRSVFLLGGNPGVAEIAAIELTRRYPGLHVVGVHCPDQGFLDREQEVVAMRRAVHDAGPDIVFVALGCPLQERVIALLYPEMPSVWWLGVGISLSFAAGEIDRAPEWMQRYSLEWLHRLAQEPQRLAGRYLRDDLPYAIKLLSTSLLSRRAGRQRG